jgi:beta-mannosidase
VSPVDDDGTLRVFVVSDRRSDFGARLTLRLVDFDGVERWRFERDLTIKALTSEAQFSAWKRDVLKGVDPSRVVLSAELRVGANLVGRNLFYFAKTRDLALPAPELTFAVEPHGETATVRVTARRLARAVWLSTPGAEGSFSDNFFDLLPGEAATVEWSPGPGSPAGSAAGLSSLLRAMTVRDTY